MMSQNQQGTDEPLRPSWHGWAVIAGLLVLIVVGGAYLWRNRERPPLTVDRISAGLAPPLVPWPSDTQPKGDARAGWRSLDDRIRLIVRYGGDGLVHYALLTVAAPPDAAPGQSPLPAGDAAMLHRFVANALHIDVDDAAEWVADSLHALAGREGAAPARSEGTRTLSFARERGLVRVALEIR